MSTLVGAHLYLDCASGLAGDMVLGALIDLGVPREIVEVAIAALELPSVALAISMVKRGSLVGCKVDVLKDGAVIGAAHGPVSQAHDHDHHHADQHPHRHYHSIRALITGRCAAPVAAWALRIFDSLAAVEAQRHGVAIADVVFHELGAVDSIADIVGCSAALAWLAPRGATCRVIPLGGGTVWTAHGRLSVPAPATLELLRGCAIEAGGESELTTPTGAAIARALVGMHVAPGAEIPGARFGPMPAGRVLGIGWGAGTRELSDRANLLRIVALEVEGTDVLGHDVVDLLEANLDDLSPVLAAPIVDSLLAAGALDAWFTPILMKKGRPAVLLSALAPEGKRAALEEVFFRESTTIGVRRTRCDRTMLGRELVELMTELGPIAVKLAGTRGGDGKLDRIYTATPELEACRALAVARGIPLRRVYEIAAAAAADYKRT